MKYVIILMGLSVSLLSADTVTLLPVADTSLFQNDPNNNFGKVTELPAGTTKIGKKGRMLLKFDLVSKIPSNAIISSASLNVTVVKVPSSPTNSKFDLRRVLQSWGEGTKNSLQHGGTATAGESSWNSRLAPSTAWSTPGGALGVEFSTTISATTSVTRLGTYTFASNTNMVQDLQDWLQNPTNNFGWVLMTESEGSSSTARRFGSRELSRSAPALAITFSVPQTAIQPELNVTGFTKDSFTFGFTTSPNQAYVVEFKNALNDALWQTLTNIAASASSQAVTFSDSLSSSPLRFYRTRTP